MNNADYKFMEELLRRESGLQLTPERAHLLESRLAPLAANSGLKDLHSLIGSLRHYAQLQRAIVDAMTTNETSFSRDGVPFTRLRDRFLPYYRQVRSKQGSLRIWSAACATGQEAYSIAMQLHDMRPMFEGWKVDILASDLSNDVVSRARQGMYSQFDVQRGLPSRLLVKYFDKDHDNWQVKGDIMRMIAFRVMNLLALPPVLGSFDVIFCRNVLMYFDTQSRRDALSALHTAMKPDSLLFLGTAENMPQDQGLFKAVPEVPGVYMRKDSTAVF